jgi:ribosomal protein L40E
MAQKRFEAMGNRDAAVIEAQGLAKSREIQGYNWQQEQQFNVSKAFAENEGFAGNPANMMAQIPLAFSMGDMLKGNMEAAVNANNTMQNSAMNMQGGTMGVQGNSMNMQGASLVCSKCNSPLPQGAKFCMNCGEKVAPKEVYCQECGAVMPADAQFCMNCGTRRNV